MQSEHCTATVMVVCGWARKAADYTSSRTETSLRLKPEVSTPRYPLKQSYATGSNHCGWPPQATDCTGCATVYLLALQPITDYRPTGFHGCMKITRETFLSLRTLEWISTTA